MIRPRRTRIEGFVASTLVRVSAALGFFAKKARVRKRYQHVGLTASYVTEPGTRFGKLDVRIANTASRIRYVI